MVNTNCEYRVISILFVVIQTKRIQTIFCCTDMGYYDPEIGRFLNEDPIRDGNNWYAYCGNNPVGFVDPSGLDPVPLWAKNINAGKATNDDYWNALNYSSGTYQGFAGVAVRNAVAIAKTAHNFTFYDQGNYSNIYTNSTKNDSSQTIASSGCGPSAMASIVTTLTGQSVSPVTIAKYCVDNGFRTDDNGTSWGFATAVSSDYGLNFRNISTSQISSSFNGNSLVLANVKAGMLTSFGHYISISGVQVRNGEDYYIVYDPNYAANKSYGRYTNKSNIIDTGIDGKILVKQSALNSEITACGVVSR